jgi:glutamate/tyrosine decarboxylase-like PLP-dependent enzyme
MDRSDLPDGAFVDPSGENAEAVRAVSEAVLDRLFAGLTSADRRSPLPQDPTIPDESIPETGRDAEVIADEVERIVEGSMNPSHPGYIGHMDTVPSTVSILGDTVAAAINNNMLSVEMSPVLSALEVRLVREIAARLGLGEEAGGVLTSGGSLATLQALAVARNRAFDVTETGLAGLDAEPVLFTSAVAHTSVRKAAMILGLGTDAVVSVETDGNDRMRPLALEAAIERAIEEGTEPFCVVATAGTTTTGNVDPLPEIREVADEHDLWFHVDAAYGGALVLSAEHRDRLAGIEGADSITFNPQKWWYVAKTSAVVLFADRSLLERSFRTGAPYMQSGIETPNLGELSVQGTRHADVLKLWLTVQHLGRSGLAQLIAEGYRLAGYLVERIAERPDLEVATDPDLNVVCFRAAPEWCPEEEWDELNARIQHALLAEYDVFVSLPTYRGSRWLRVVLSNPFTEESTIDRLFDGTDDLLAAEKTSG